MSPVRSVRSAWPAGLVWLGVGLVAAGCGGTAAGTEGSRPDGRPDGRLVLVSGRDDHGLLAQETVALYGAPGRSDAVAEVADATLVRVVRIDGTWLRVATVEGPAAEGWVDDYYLRGEVRLVGEAPTCAGRLAGRPVEGGTPVVVSAVRGGQVLVATSADPGWRGWVSRGDLQELPPQGADCGEDPPGSRHSH